MADKLVEQLLEELGAFGIECDESQAEALCKHLRLVVEKNREVNLTRIVDLAEGVTLHVVDSLLPLACDKFKLGPEDSFVDIGTGAGFPGIPLSVMTGATGYLIDSVGKKVAAVDGFCEELGLKHVYGVHSRVEDLSKDLYKKQALVIARAVAQSNVLVEYASPLLKQHGLLVLEKANISDEEFEAASKAAEICGFDFVSRETFELPRDLGHREILIFEKIRRSKIKLPRRAGVAKKDPLGLE